MYIVVAVSHRQPTLRLEEFSKVGHAIVLHQQRTRNIVAASFPQLANHGNLHERVDAKLIKLATVGNHLRIYANLRSNQFKNIGKVMGC